MVHCKQMEEEPRMMHNLIVVTALVVQKLHLMPLELQELS